MAKLEVGVFSFTCDEGCSMQILEVLNYKYPEWKNKLDFVDFRLIKTPGKTKALDVAFVEGAIATKDDITRIKQIRGFSKNVVAMGTCAIIGAPSNHRNFFDKKTTKSIQPFLKKFKHLDKVQPLKNFIKVDSEITGCPIDEKDFVDAVEMYLGKQGVKNAKKF